MTENKIKVVAPVKVEPTAETQAIKGTLYIQPNGDQFFEAADNSPKEVKRSNGYKLVYSNGTTKHYTTSRRHVFFVSFTRDISQPIGSILPREVVRFCAECMTKKIKYYLSNPQNND